MQDFYLFRSLVYFILPFTDVRNFSDRNKQASKEVEKCRRSVNVALFGLHCCF